MSKFIKGQDRRSQGKLFPERLEDCVDEYNPVRVIDVFIDDLDISGLGFKAEAAATGRPGYDPKTMPNNHWVWEWCWSDNLYNVRMFLCFRSKPESTPKWMFRQTKVAQKAWVSYAARDVTANLSMRMTISNVLTAGILMRSLMAYQGYFRLTNGTHLKTTLRKK